MLLSNNPGLTRVASCLYEVSNVYNLKSYNGDLTRMRSSMPKSDELLFTQWPESPQKFQMLRHSNGKILQQRSRFYALWIKKVDGNFFLRVASNWFIKFDGEEKLGVQLDYDYIQKRWKMGAMLRAEQRVERLIAKRKQEKQEQEKYEKRKERKRLAEARRRARLRAEKLKIKTDMRASIVPKLTSKAKPKAKPAKPAKPVKPKAALKPRAQAKIRVPKRKRGKALCKLAIDKSKERDEHAKRVRRPDKPGLRVAC